MDVDYKTVDLISCPDSLMVLVDRVILESDPQQVVEKVNYRVRVLTTAVNGLGLLLINNRSFTRNARSS